MWSMRVSGFIRKTVLRISGYCSFDTPRKSAPAFDIIHALNFPVAVRRKREQKEQKACDSEAIKPTLAPDAVVKLKDVESLLTDWGNKVSDSSIFFIIS